MYKVSGSCTSFRSAFPSSITRISHRVPIMPRLFSTLLILASALAAHAGIQASDFSGVGKIYVLKSDNWNTASPKEKVGCLDDHGKFVHAGPACGTFSRRPTYPYDLSTAQGNCTFDDETQARNTDSVYGTLDYAWSCKDDHPAQIWDGFYSVVCLLSCIGFLSK